MLSMVDHILRILMSRFFVILNSASYSDAEVADDFFPRFGKFGYFFLYPSMTLTFLISGGGGSDVKVRLK